jgi:NAD(P)-dependent dehydrogenase (short-subunit alcohol dehydrogenase family)
MGRAAAIRLHAEGYELLLADLNTNTIEALATLLDASTAAVDVTSDDKVDALAARCSDGIDALVISAGLSASMAPFEKIVDVNLGGTARVLNRLLPMMNPQGAAVCFASMAAYMAGPIDPQVEAILVEATDPDLGKRLSVALPSSMRLPGVAYALSKLAILKLVQRTATQWGRRGVRVCSISPGVIDTPMGRLEREANPEANEALKVAPIPRLGTAEEVAHVVAFLCSPQASYITGCDLIVDGGWVGAIQSATADSPIALALSAARERSEVRPHG